MLVTSTVCSTSAELNCHHLCFRYRFAVVPLTQHSLGSHSLVHGYVTTVAYKSSCDQLVRPTCFQQTKPSLLQNLLLGLYVSIPAVQLFLHDILILLHISNASPPLSSPKFIGTPLLLLPRLLMNILRPVPRPILKELHWQPHCQQVSSQYIPLLSPASVPSPSYSPCINPHFPSVNYGIISNTVVKGRQISSPAFLD